MRHVRRRAAPASPVVARAPPSPPSLMSGRRRFLMGTTRLCWTRWPSCCLTRQMTTGTRPRRILTPIRGGLSRALCRRLVLQRLWSPHLRKLRSQNRTRQDVAVAVGRRSPNGGHGRPTQSVPTPASALHGHAAQPCAIRVPPVPCTLGRCPARHFAHFVFLQAEAVHHVERCLTGHLCLMILRPASAVIMHPLRLRRPSPLTQDPVHPARRKTSIYLYLARLHPTGSGSSRSIAATPYSVLCTLYSSPSTHFGPPTPDAVCSNATILSRLSLIVCRLPPHSRRNGLFFALRLSCPCLFRRLAPAPSRHTPCLPSLPVRRVLHQFHFHASASLISTCFGS